MSGRIDAESVNGRVGIGGGSFSDVAMETVNGRIDFESNLRERGDLDIETVNGKVVVNFVGSLSAEIDVNLSMAERPKEAVLEEIRGV